jgi:putative oxidoreductase
MRPSNVVYWIVRVGAAIIMLQTLYFKFTGSAESIYIFQTVGMEPWGRIGVGALELIASILILINVTAWMGAALAAGLMVGAIGMHLTLLGIVVKDDGGQLFIYALLVLIFSLYILFVNKQRLTEMAARFYKVG